MVQEAIATAKEQSVRFFSREGFLNKRGVGFVLGAAILIVAMCIPGSEAISRQGIMGIASLLFAVVFWVCGTLPLGVSGILALIIAVLTGAADMNPLSARSAARRCGSSWRSSRCLRCS